MTSLDKQPPSFEYPNWAKWLAQEADGTWWCYEVEPLQYHKGWYENEVGLYLRLGMDEPSSDWRNSLTRLA